MNDEIILRIPFAIRKFKNIDTFVLTIFPDLKSYIQEQIQKGIQKSALEAKVYFELGKRFKLFVLRNYSGALDEYINRESKHADKEVMKEVLLSTISVTLNLYSIDGHKLTNNDYLVSLRNIINEFE